MDASSAPDREPVDEGPPPPSRAAAAAAAAAAFLRRLRHSVSCSSPAGASSLALGVETPNMAATSGDGAAPPKSNAAAASLTSSRLARTSCAAKIFEYREQRRHCSAMVLYALSGKMNDVKNSVLPLCTISTALGTT